MVLNSDFKRVEAGFFSFSRVESKYFFPRKSDPDEVDLSPDPNPVNISSDPDPVSPSSVLDSVNLSPDADPVNMSPDSDPVNLSPDLNPVKLNPDPQPRHKGRVSRKQGELRIRLFLDFRFRIQFSREFFCCCRVVFRCTFS